MTIILCGISNYEVSAQIYPPEVDLTTIDWEFYTPPTSLPNYLEPTTDNYTGNTVIRISDQSAFGCTCSQLRHRYSKKQPWNADGTMIMTDGWPAKILDGNTYEIIGDVYCRSIWSNVDPQLTFDTHQNKLFRRNVVTQQEVVLRTFSEYDNVSIGYGEGNLSNDDQWVALIGRNGSNQTIFVYDILNDVITGSKYIGTTPLDWVSISQSGNYCVVQYDSWGSGPTNGVKSFDRFMQNEVHLENAREHGDIGYDMDGNEVYVSHANFGNHSYSYTRLDNGVTKGLFPFSGATGDLGAAGGHLSTRNINRPGWAYVTDSGDLNNLNGWEAPKEIFAIKLDDSNTIQRFAKHNTNFEAANASYNHQAHACPNRDGTKVIFASNWYNSSIMNQNYPLLWVVEVAGNQSDSVNAGEDVSICEGETTSLTATGAQSYVWRDDTGAVIGNSASVTVTPDQTTTYTVTGTDSSGAETTDTVTVFLNPLPTAGAGDDVTICQGETTTLTATGGDTYLWNTGQTTASINVSPNSTTTYTVTVTQNDCEDSASVTVTVLDGVNPNAGPDIAICEGESATLTASGGTDYEWNTGQTTATITVSPTVTTTYTVTVSDNGCSAADEVTVTVNPLPEADAGPNVTINYGDSITLSASGGSSFIWNTGESTQNITVSPTSDTTYSVTVTENGCQDIDYVTVFVNIDVNANAGPDVTICQGESTVLTASGGETYEWSTGETTQSITVNPNVSTTYSVIATTGNVSDTDEVIVFVNPIPSANAGPDVSILNGESTTLTATGGATYLWNTGETTQSITVSPNQTTTYSVQVELDGCQNSDEVTVTVNEQVTANAGPDVTICEGESTVLSAQGGDSYQWSTGETTQSITVSPTSNTVYTVIATVGEVSDTDDVTVYVNPVPLADAGPDVSIGAGDSATLTATGGDSYAWSTGETTQSITVSPIDNTTYEVTVSQNGCQATDQVTVFITDTVVANAGEDVNICAGSSTVLTASGGDTYLWSTGETTQSITVSPLTTEVYTVTAFSGNESDTDDVTVTVDDLPQITAGEDITICNGELITLIATGGNNYTWSTGETTQSINVSPQTTTTYTVSSSNNSCEATDEITVTVLESPVADAGPNQNTPSGQSITLTASGGGTYLWSTGETTQSITVTPLLTTHYTVIVSNGVCEDSDTVVVSVNGQLSIYAGEDVTICEGEPVELTAATNGHTVEWSTGETTETIIVSPAATTTYTVTAFRGSNTATDEVTVFVNPSPDPNLGEDVSLCLGEPITLTSAEADSYIWSTGETTQSITVIPDTTTAYTVLTIIGECEGEDEIVVTVNPIPDAYAGEDSSICEGETRILTASGGDTYLWSTGETTQNIEVAPTTTTTYSVIVSQNGCESSDEVTVTVNALP
ncbi:MAG: hypothetical protein HKO90_11260, partial [Flavobacteriaceae bacterium]|nr:hypothetical protein [Flavobacteriaceae bacterium]